MCYSFVWATPANSGGAWGNAPYNGSGNAQTVWRNMFLQLAYNNPFRLTAPKGAFAAAQIHEITYVPAPGTNAHTSGLRGTITAICGYSGNTRTSQVFGHPITPGYPGFGMRFTQPLYVPKLPKTKGGR